ncbi:hypothetical protein B9479_002840 [Cryptococcus floricola]|uniref:WHIM1 domain-containing protein n=1 Tax=Cryptococcus floricola TaxID=2591691 RepID=A0A5D3AY68_9TREE|nr:hypothetical protein B9479_002840 [Cryptococcus floricola]
MAPATSQRATPRQRSPSTASIQAISPHKGSAAAQDQLWADIDPEDRKIAQAKKRHDDDVKRHLGVDNIGSGEPQNDWQVAYIWSFILKFNLRHRIARLESIADLERCLYEPVANRPDDIFEGILICFLSNLKPGSRNISAENIQSSISSYISEKLSETSEWTVWDRPWPLNEEQRASCCLTDDPYRAELGRLRYPGESMGARVERNPIKRVEAKGGGLFEMDWRDRVALMRQLVDWQLTHSANIRDTVNTASSSSTTKPKKGSNKPVEEVPAINVEPLGLNRDKQRVWSLDDSWRLYRSGNPFKRPCPMESVSDTKQDYLAYVESIVAYGAQEQSQAAYEKAQEDGSKGKKKADKGNAGYKKWVKGVQDEKKLGQALEGRVENIEKEEGRVQRAKRKIAQVVQLQEAAEMRTTRTRRPNRKVDYSYGDSEEEPIPISPPRKSTRPSRSGRGAPSDEPYFALDSRGRPSIPGMEFGLRGNKRNGLDAVSEIVDVEGGEELNGEKKRGMKGYAWVGNPDASSPAANGTANGESTEASTPAPGAGEETPRADQSRGTLPVEEIIKVDPEDGENGEGMEESTEGAMEIDDE